MDKNSQTISEASKALLHELLPLIREEIMEKTTEIAADFLQGLSLPLLIKRQVLLVGNIDQRMGEEISRQILLLNANPISPINLFIHSKGGEMNAALQICDVIKHSEAHVDGTVLGNAHSGAFLVLQSCHERKAYPHATFLLHGPRAIDSVDNENFGSFIRLLKRDHGKILEEIADRSGQPLVSLKILSREDRVLSVLDAKKLGFIDKIIKHTGRQ